ncbi:hypothetical protein SAMN05216593_105377 [Pseudomonas asturiensis]|uniref:Uncharacterized protein n=1 Tax=Pseudomonas asturiensis TaxID=1190415 RepID=A0A1M7NBY4_9PSED|nr:hypothetical protein [Pseudomonas asturiensis]SHN01050.1 hypothetical protein SAMN05216593_105377 [Pseudomonas asturiensis]
MFNKHLRYLAYRPKKQGPITLLPPVVPLADDVDGLIKTVDLASDVTVEFPLWDLPALGDKYSLLLNGLSVGDEQTLSVIPSPGTTLNLTIPVDVALKTDGMYQVQYRLITFPGLDEITSPAVPIIVDRTPPGAYQLGYMAFPDEAKDGLTLEELRLMGDTLTGSIFGYSGLKRGDLIKTYWGTVPGPEVELSGDEDEEKPIEVPFSKNFLIDLKSPAGATYYTVTDRAGNVSADSKKVTIPLFLTEVVPGLPAPVIEDFDGVIDYKDAKAGVEVLIPGSSTVVEGDQILLHWGSEKLGPEPVATDDLNEPFVLVFNVQFLTIETAQNGTRQLKYEVIRNGQVAGVSDNLMVDVNIELPVPSPLNKPTVRGSSSTPSNEDNVIDENDFELNATVLIDWNTDFKALQTITVFWGDQEVLDQPYTITNSDVVTGRPLLLTALNSKFKPVGTGDDIKVHYTLNATGNPNMSISADQRIVVRSKEELPGGVQGPNAPVFTDLNVNGAINAINGANGAPVFIEPYDNIEIGQTITFLYEGYDSLVGGNKVLEWTYLSEPLTQTHVENGFHLTVPRDTLDEHYYGHVEASFQVKGDKGQGNSKRGGALIDMRTGRPSSV